MTVTSFSPSGQETKKLPQFVAAAAAAGGAFAVGTALGSFQPQNPFELQ